MNREIKNTDWVRLCSALAVAFMILKITNFIHWSWWWVIAPLWVPVLVIGLPRVIREIEDMFKWFVKK